MTTRLPSRSPSLVTGLVLAGVSALVAFVVALTTLGGVVGDQNGGLTVSLAGLVARAAEACVVDGPVSGLTAEQATDADRIVSAAYRAID